MSDVFVSYAHEDAGVVDRLRAALAAEGREVWVDTADIEPADRWRVSAHEGIERSDAFLFVISPHSLRSEPCLGELEHAASLNKRLVPVCVDDGAVEMHKPRQLDELSWIMLRPGDDFDAGVRAIIHVLDTDLDVVRTHTRILVRAKAWELGGRRASPLLRGDELRLAEQWLARAGASGSPPTDLQQQFIAASRRASTRRLRIVAGVSAAVAAIAVGLSIYALIQRSNAIHQATLATSRQLAAVSENTLSTDLHVALLLAVKAFHTNRNPQTRTALLEADLYSPRLERFLPMGAAVTSLAGSDDRTAAVAGLADGRVMRWELDRPKPERVATLTAGAKNVAVNADGHVVVAVDGSEALLWRDGRGVSKITCVAGRKPDAAAVSPSGRTVVVHCGPSTFEGPQSVLVVSGTTGVPSADHALSGSGIQPSILVVPSDAELFMLDGTYGRWERRHLPDWQLELASSAQFGVHQYLPGYSSRGGFFAVSNGGQSIPVWPTDVPTAAFDPPRAAQAPISSPTALSLSPDGAELAVADSGTIYVAPVGSPKASYTSPAALVGNGSVNSDALRFFGDGLHLLSASGDTVAIWDLTQFDRLARAEATSLSPPCNGCGGALASVSPDGQKVAGVADAGDYVVVQDLGGHGKPEIVGPYSFGPPVWKGETVLLPAVGRSPTGLPADIHAWRAVGADDAILASALSADGRTVTIVDQRGGVFVEDPDGGNVELHVAGPRDLAHAELPLYGGQAAIDAEAGLVAIVDDGSTLITDLGSRKVTRVPGSDAAYVAFAGGRLLVQRQSGALELWDAHGSVRERSTAGDRSFAGFYPVPDQGGDLVARQRSNGSIAIVDLTSGATLGTISAPASPTLGLRLGLAFSADGGTLVTVVQAVGANDSLILEHRIGDDALIEEGCSAGSRSLTKSEWRSYVGTNPPADLAC